MNPAEELITAAVASLERGKQGQEPYVLAAGAKDRLAAVLERVPDDLLTFAMAELCALAGFVAAERQSLAARAALLDVAAGALPRMKDAAAAEAQVKLQRAQSGALAHVTGAPRTALPQPPSPPPEGSARGGVLARLNLDKALPK
ncbi:MAG: hypothetical protein IT382_19420 [Deltaproteobacteria bacterium]|nr:hypothetical protein [Deltaproteobacteria bacterium]